MDGWISQRLAFLKKRSASNCSNLPFFRIESVYDVLREMREMLSRGVRVIGNRKTGIGWEARNFVTATTTEVKAESTAEPRVKWRAWGKFRAGRVVDHKDQAASGHGEVDGSGVVTCEDEVGYRQQRRRAIVLDWPFPW